MATRTRVLVEFTKDTEVRKQGDRLLVDSRSADSFVKKEVARVVDLEAEAAAAAGEAAAAEPVDAEDADAAPAEEAEAVEPSDPFSFTKTGDDD